MREKIYIDGEPTVELDYSAHHPRILYNLRKLNLNFDPYTCEKNLSPDKRNLYKSVFLICLNTDKRENALRALYKEIEENPKFHSLIPNWDKSSRNLLIDNLINTNPKIKDDFFKEKYFKLMNIDSTIAHNILQRFTAKGILVLCVHDSFIIQERYKDDLKNVMIEEYDKILKFNPVIK